MNQNQNTRLDPEENRRSMSPIVYVLIAFMLAILIALIIGCEAGLILSRIGVYP